MASTTRFSFLPIPPLPSLPSFLIGGPHHEQRDATEVPHLYQAPDEIRPGQAPRRGSEQEILLVDIEREEGRRRENLNEGGREGVHRSCERRQIMKKQEKIVART